MTSVDNASPSLPLRHKLAQLNTARVRKLLGNRAEHWLQLGGAYDIDLERQVELTQDAFTLDLPGSASISLFVPDGARRLRWACTCGESVCDHVGAAFSLLLEEKIALGLASRPNESQPVDPLEPEELVRLALEARAERARKEKMRLKSQQPKRLWTDYRVTNSHSGKSYRVALRGWQPGESYCSCPDFRKNGLGVCKHILFVQNKVRKQFSQATQNKPYVQRQLALHLAYGSTLELRLLMPEALPRPALNILKPLMEKPIENMVDLCARLQKLERIGQSCLIYPDAEDYLQRELFRHRLQALIADIRENPVQHPLRTTLLNVPLLPYQLDGIAFAVGAGRAILADDMGLGKTIQGIGVAELLARECGIQRVLIISPTSLKSQWRAEIGKFSQRDAQLVVGPAKLRRQQYQQPVFFTLCNYEQVMRDQDIIAHQTWDLIILDEGQRIKNWETKTTQVIKSLKSTFALVLSGTPIENRLDDLFSIVEFVDDRRLGPAYQFFNKHRIVDAKGKVLGYQHLNEVKRQLEPVLLRRTRASVQQQLPPRHTEIIRIPPTAQQKEIDDAQRQTISSIIRKRFLTEVDLLRLQKALLICRMAADSTYLVTKEEPSYSSKLEELENLLGTLAQEADRKIILFSEWTTMLDKIQPILDGLLLDSVRLDGSVSQKKRQALVDRFQQDPECRVFMTTNAGSTGLNLQAANTIINVDLPWNPAVLEQRIARAHRMGQQRAVQVYLLVSEGMLEESLLGTLASKQALALAALDPDTDVDQVDLTSGIDELKRRLEVLVNPPAAPVDQASQRAVDAQLDAQQRRADAGGEMLVSTLRFLGEMLPEPTNSAQTRQMAAMMTQVEQRLAECTHQDDQGNLQLRLNLGNTDSLHALARTVARLAVLGGASSDEHQTSINQVATEQATL